MEYFIGIVIGLLVGLTLGWLTASVMRRRAVERELSGLRDSLREAFAALAGEALDANSRRLGEQTGAVLDAKKALIDQSVRQVNERLGQLGEFVQRVEADRKGEFGRLGEAIGSLRQSAGQISEILASKQRRGAWGERMADDILRLSGLAEGVNYDKQSDETTEGQQRPDFTFHLPNDLKANMDVKFPLESYRRYLDAEGDSARAGEAQQLVKDVRYHVRAVASRGYVNTKEGTVDYALVFLPSEQIYSLVLETCPDLMDEAMRQRIVLTGPMSLYAMLSVIRQAAENANLMRRADEVMAVIHEFGRQFTNYNIELDKLGQRIEQTQKQFELVAKTRTNVLQKQIDRVEDLRANRESEAEGEDLQS